VVGGKILTKVTLVSVRESPPLIRAD